MAEALNLVGERFGKLLVVERLANNKNKNTMWRCLCDCGKERIAVGYDLTHHRTTSCGHHRGGRYEDLSGKRFGKLKAISIAKRSCHKVFWICACDCGNVTTVCSCNLQSGHTKSCGCLSNEKTKSNNNKPSKESLERKHYVAIMGGYEYKRLRYLWNSMKQRCRENYHGKHIYYDRGIKVCDEWMDFAVFADWSLNNGYGSNLSLDRIDNCKGYSPDNCRWVTWKIQANNTRKNVYIEYMGKTQTMKQWCEELGLSYGAIRARHRQGITVPQLFEPVIQRAPKTKR